MITARLSWTFFWRVHVLAGVVGWRNEPRRHTKPLLVQKYTKYNELEPIRNVSTWDSTISFFVSVPGAIKYSPKLRIYRNDNLNSPLDPPNFLAMFSVSLPPISAVNGRVSFVPFSRSFTKYCIGVMFRYKRCVHAYVHIIIKRVSNACNFFCRALV